MLMSFLKMQPSFRPNSYVFSKAPLTLLIFRKLALDKNEVPAPDDLRKIVKAVVQQIANHGFIKF